METRCPACNSDRVAEGRIDGREGASRFELPSQGSGFWRTFGPSVKIEEPAFLCFQCGMVWTKVDKEAAQNEITRRGNDELLERLHISGRPRRKWLWLLFGRR
jgi:hypothetical protein